MGKKTEATAPVDDPGTDAVAEEVQTTEVPTSDADKVAVWREATEQSGNAGEPEPKDDKPDGDKTEEEGDAGAGGDGDGEGAGDGEGGEDEGRQTPEELAEAAEAEHRAAVDAEVKQLGLKGTSEKRFRELSDKVKALAPLEERVPQMEQRIARADEFEDRIIATGATPEQFGRAMAAIEAVNSTDPIVLGNLERVLEEELDFVRKKLGKKAGDYDPLTEAGNEDLKQDVESGELSEARALEIAASRRQGAAVVETRQASTQAAEAQRLGVEAVAELGAELRAVDPLFGQKMKAIEATVRQIQATKPPHEWRGAVRAAYLAAKVSPPAQERRPPGRVATSSRQAVPDTGLEEKPKDALDALRQAVRQAEKKRA